MQTGRDPGLEMAARETFGALSPRRAAVIAPYHLRNFVVCINSHPQRK